MQKRARLTLHAGRALQQHGQRKLNLALESGLPSELAWALRVLLVATTAPDTPLPPVGTMGHVERRCLDLAVNLPRNPTLLSLLLPLALPPAAEPGGPAASAATELARLQWRQTWLVLRNLSLAPENETKACGSRPFRALVLHTLRRAIHPHDLRPPLSAHALRAEDAAITRAAAEGAEAELSALPSQCQLNPLCTRGYRHGGRGGPCRIPRPKPAADDDKAAGRGKLMPPLPSGSGRGQSAAAPRPTPADDACAGGDGLPLLLSGSHDAHVTACAADAFSCLCRQTRPSDWVDADGALDLPASLHELGALLASLSQLGEPALVGPVIEGLAKLVAHEDCLDGVAAAERRAEPPLLSALADAPGALASIVCAASCRGGFVVLGEAGAAFVQEAALELLHALASACAPARRRLIAEMPTLVALLSPAAGGLINKKAAAVLQVLVDTPANHAAFRPHEPTLGYLATHCPAEGGSHANAQILEMLRELAAAA